MEKLASSSSDDEEAQINDIKQLQAVLREESEDASESSRGCSVASSHYSSVQDQELANIEKALALNILAEAKLGQLEKTLISRLRQCRQRIGEIQGLSSTSNKTDKQQAFSFLVCGRPYFRDKKNFPAPDNDDTILMAKSGMYDFCNISSVPGWTVKDKSNFMSVMTNVSRDLKKTELLDKVVHLQREAKRYPKPQPKIVKEIAAIKKEIEAVKTKSLSELALPIEQDYDWDNIACQLNRRHTAQEYASLWRLFLHPKVNKGSWTDQEHKKLLKVIHQFQAQDWDTIAKELDTGRTGYQCFVYYRTNMCNTSTGQKWSTEEEEYLKRLIEYYQEEDYIPWGKVAAAMNKRTKIQIYNKFSRLMEQRKGRFVPEEDAVLLTCIAHFGTNFRRIAKYLPGRSSIQLRARYTVLGSRSRTSTVWTAEEDKKLIQIMANQDSDINFSSLTKHFPGKHRVNVRCRYLTLVKWMRRHPNVDIEKAPRRGARRLGHGKMAGDLSEAVENLRKRIQTEVETKKYYKINKNSSDEAIDDVILASLVTEHTREKESRKAELQNDESLTSLESVQLNETRMHRVLLLLKAKLNKDRFLKSDYSIKYMQLPHIELNPPVLKKSYSRKDKPAVISAKDYFPDIWGKKTLDVVQYVLPPNYATITGCRKLMAYVSGDAHDLPFNINVLKKKNNLLKAQLDLLLERCDTLFLWPMLLSNEYPVQSSVYQTKRKKKLFGLPGVPEVTIPKQIIQNTEIVNENIDLEETIDRRKIVLENKHVGNDDFFYIASTST